jgi:hypothetical protein
MYIHTGKATVGRNFYTGLSSGSVTIKDKDNGRGEKIVLKIRGGDIAGQTNYNRKDGTKTEIEYGHHVKTWKHGRLTEHKRIKKGTNLAIDPELRWEKEKVKIGRYNATLFRRAYGNSISGEQASI